MSISEITAALSHKIAPPAALDSAIHLASQAYSDIYDSGAVDPCTAATLSEIAVTDSLPLGRIFRPPYPFLR